MWTQDICPFLDVLSLLSATQVGRAWRATVEAHAMWGCDRIASAQARMGACVVQTKPRRRGVPCAILSMPRRPQLSNFVYGELTLESLARLLARARIKAGSVFADLGCGAGRQLFGAAALVPRLRKLVGFELMEGYIDDARARLACLASLGETPDVDLHHDDFTVASSAHHWTSADVVLATSTCFDQAQMVAIATLARNLRPGARIVTLDKLLPAPPGTFRLLACCHCRGDWGPALGYIQERITLA